MVTMRNHALSLITLSLLLVLLSFGVAAQVEKVNIFKGNVSIGGSSSASGGAVVEAFIGSSSSAAESYTVGSLFGAPEYAVDFSCDAGNIAFLKVWGINATWQACANSLTNYTNLSVSLVADYGACSYANACSGGYCCSGATAVNQSAGSGLCQAVACGTGITLPSFALSAASITTAQTVNFTINITNQLRNNITSANFTLVTGSTVISRNFTIPSSSRNQNISYKIFASSETAAAGTYNITAVQVNDNGSIANVTIVTNMNFTVTAVPAATTDTGGGSSSSGSGGGGVALPSETSTAVTVSGPVTTEVSFTKSADLAVLGIELETTADAAISSGQVKVSETTVSKATAAIIETSTSKVYKYLSITKINIKESDIKNAKVKFEIPATWLTENSIGPSTVKLNRLVDDKWVVLTTSLVSSGNGKYVYEAETPGFSVFAVSGEQKFTAFQVIDAIREFYAGSSKYTAFGIIDLIRAFYA